VAQSWPKRLARSSKSDARAAPPDRARRPYHQGSHALPPLRSGSVAQLDKLGVTGSSPVPPTPAHLPMRERHGWAKRDVRNVRFREMVLSSVLSSYLAESGDGRRATAE
jgi:hypothetical protein